MSPLLLDDSQPDVASGRVRLAARLVADERDWTALAADWDRLAAGQPFRSWAWNECWWRHYQTPGDRLHIVVLEDENGGIHGIAPWHRSYSWRLGRVVRFLGTGEVCSEHLTVLCEPKLRGQVIETLAEWITKTDGAHWDTLELDGIDADNTPIMELVAALERRGFGAHRRSTLNAWRVDLPDAWDDYVRQLSRTRRERVKQLFRRKFDTGEAVVRRATDAASLAAGWEVLETLHRRRWESQGECGCFAAPRYAAFHREVAPRLLAGGQLRLQWIELSGRPIAVEYSLCDDATVYYYQSGLEPDAESERPGWLDVSSSIRRAIEDGQRGFDFLRGDEAYKSSWRATSRPLEEIRVFAPHWGGRAHHAIWRSGLRVKVLGRQAASQVRKLLSRSIEARGAAKSDDN